MSQSVATKAMRPRLKCKILEVFFGASVVAGFRCEFLILEVIVFQHAIVLVFEAAKVLKRVHF